MFFPIMADPAKGPKPVPSPLRIGLIGTRGQLGQELSRRFSEADLSPGIELHALDRPSFDITDPASLAGLSGSGFDVVVNTSAYNAVDAAETAVRECFELNAFAPLFLARACREAGAALVHVSTDYVMSGGVHEEEQIPYPEEAPTRPLSVYGLSKATGERLVMENWDRSWIVRTCGLYGGSGSGQKGGNFVTTMIRLAREGRPLRVVSDQRVGPTAAQDLARGIARLVTGSFPFGLWHLTNGGHASWYEFAQKIFELTGLSPELTPIPLASYRPAAPRSPFSVLSNEKAHRAGIVLPPWESALEDFLGQNGLIPS